LELFLFLLICLLKTIFNNEEVIKLDIKPVIKSESKNIIDLKFSKTIINLRKNKVENYNDSSYSWINDFYDSSDSSWYYDSSDSWDDSSGSVDEKIQEINDLLDELYKEIENIINFDSEEEKIRITDLKDKLNELKNQIENFYEFEYDENEGYVNSIIDILYDLESEVNGIIEEEKGRYELINRALDILDKLLTNESKNEAKKNSDKANKYKGLFIFVLVVLILLILIILFCFIKMKLGFSLFKQNNSNSIENTKIIN